MSDVIKMELAADGICRIVMNRPERGNAQNNELLYALDAALTEASRDVSVRVIILAGEGKHFSTGHDLGEFDPLLEGIDTVGVWGGFSMPAMEGYMAFEEEAYFGLCWRWRNIPKPIIAEVQGRVIAGGLMLAWICDLIVASEDATFADPVVAAGHNGVEYFAHPWEVGARKAKEMLFTGQGISAWAAERLGMVNRVVSLDRLTDETLELAKIIAEKPVMGVRLAKMSVNQTQDEQGFYNALRAAMGLQHLSHAQSFAVHGSSADESAAALIRKTLKLPLLP
ncbi:enoyl-CoA hydratase (plasmid) [Sphingomonas paeninsulae]|jgi:enoyl-CoA hydratase|uniref:Enoyl-CoA hydratase n=1 Tax=Sphingomonas paeninsulae TaxID=2319844 RepID=A0A494THK8_SPHPE|nr:enoyl-CoA hydratase [Sphingomonas paeninsulae]AYJ84918.1 enoyl-CoA hydratase [Sphingomonas paeninsulae]